MHKITHTTFALLCLYCTWMYSFANGNFISKYRAETLFQTVPTDVYSINFSRAIDEIPDGFIRDSGAPYGLREDGLSYGWLTSDGQTPLDLTTNTRNRAIASLGLLKNTVNHMQYNDVGGTNGSAQEGIWEIELANGNYYVTVVVGDGALDSANSAPLHTINAEGILMVDKFIPQGGLGASTRFIATTSEIVVADGRLTIDAFGGFNTKISSIVIRKELDLKFNFSLATDAAPDGYIKDSGAPFGDNDAGYAFGWLNAVNGEPLDLSRNARNRGFTTLTPIQNTLLHMQYGNTNGSSGVLDEGIWELEVPSGSYEVFVEVGDGGLDALGTEPLHTINAEGVRLIDQFSPQGLQGSEIRFTSGKATVNVGDGRLTIDASGGFNTKITQVAIKKIADVTVPFFVNITPPNNAPNVLLNDLQINVELVIPKGYGLDPLTINGNINLYELTPTGEVIVASNANDTGGGDALTLTPVVPLKEETTYIFRLSSGIEVQNFDDATDRLSFIPLESRFTTGTEKIISTPDIDLTDISFTKIVGDDLGEGTVSQRFSSLVIGPDQKLYASTIGDFQSDGQIYRWNIAGDGTLTDLEILSPQLTSTAHPVTGTLDNDNRLIIGFAFDPASTPENLIAYISHNTASISSGPEWDGKISRLSGLDLTVVEDVIVNLPRSAKDHLTNSLSFDQNGDLFFNQGSNSAGGEPDANWNFRPERLLSAAVLRLELDKLPAQLPLDVFTTDDIAVINAAPANTLIMNDGTYNPYATTSPLTIFASGIRNAYDLVWHTNGWLYVPANGTAGNRTTSPNSPATANYPLARRIDGLTSIDNIPALSGGETQKDWLFKTLGGSYHGHPNPYRGEFVLNHGGIAYSGVPGQQEVSYTDVEKYPNTLLPDPNYREPAFDFGKNKSPNGVLEYKSEAFGGRLKGLLFVTRFSGQDDVLLLDLNTNGNVLNSYNTITGLQGFDDPLDIVEDVRNGNIYVSEYDRDNNSMPRLTLLRTSGGVMTTNVDELLFEITTNQDAATTAAKIATLTNEGQVPLLIDTITVEGNFASEFEFSEEIPFTIAPGGSKNLRITYAPDLEEINLGYQDAALIIKGTADESQELEIGLFGLKKRGIGGDKEPTLQAIVDVLGISVNVGWDTATTTISDDLLGDEIRVGSWTKATDSLVTLTPVGRYSPAEKLPFGWYATAITSLNQNEIGVLENGSRESQTLYPQLVSGITTFDPQDQEFGIFVESSFYDRTIYTEDRLNTDGSAHRARIYPFKDRQGNLVEDSFLIVLEDAENGDYQDYMFVISNVTPIIKSNASLVIENRTKIPGTSTGFPAEDYFTFHRNANPNGSQFTEVHDTNIMRLNNTGSDNLIVSEIAISDDESFTYSLVTDADEPLLTPISIAPGESQDVLITYVGNGVNGAKGLQQGEITIRSNADNAPEASASLHAAFMLRPEGENEIDVEQVVRVFGFKTNVRSIVNDQGTITPPNPNPVRPGSNYPKAENIDAGYEGDMILSSTFVQADPTQPVRGIQLSAFHGPGSNGARFIAPDDNTVIAGFNFFHTEPYFQTVLPQNNNVINADSAELIEGAFRIWVMGYRSSGGNAGDARPDLLGLRIYKVIDNDGNIIPNDFIVVQDFIREGCGAASANCDWNDNVYYFSNIRPEALPSATPIAPYFASINTAFEYELSPSFDKAYPGNTLNYTIRLANGETLPEWLALDTTTGVLSGTPAVDASALYTLTVTATDSNGNSVSSELLLSTDQELFANDDTVDAIENAETIFDELVVNDINPTSEPLIISAIEPALNGTATLNADQTSITYIPVNDFIGQDQLKYTIRSIDGQEATATVFITVIGATIASQAILKIDRTDGEAPLQVFLTSEESINVGANLSYFWDFGDGNTSIEVAPTHVFKTVGSYTITLTITDSIGVSSDSVQVNVIEPTIGTPSITGFTLINSTTNEDLLDLQDGMSLSTAMIDTSNLNIRANTNTATLGSVVIALKGAINNSRTESSEPYALFGDNAGDYFNASLAVGDYVLSAKPYSEPFGRGEVGNIVQINFSISDDLDQDPPSDSSKSNASKNNEIIVFPNPAKSKLTIQIPNATAATNFVVLNIHGTVVSKYTAPEIAVNGNYQLSVAHLAPGFYMIRINGEDGFFEMVSFLKR